MIGRVRPAGKENAMKKTIRTITCLTVICLMGGCGGSSRDSLWEKIDELQAQKNELETRAESLEAENQQLIEQSHTLDSINPDIRLSALDRLDRIEIGKHSGLSDENGDGQIDTLRIHLVPIDQTGDVIKAPGQVSVSLWNLNTSAAENLLGEWTVPAEDLKAMWGHSLTGRYYRLKLDLPQALQTESEDLTVKVKFTDYLTGKVLKAQTPIATR